MEAMKDNCSLRPYLWKRRILFMCGMLMFISGYLLSDTERGKTYSHSEMYSFRTPECRLSASLNRTNRCFKIEHKDFLRHFSECVRSRANISFCRFVIRNRFGGRVGNQMFQVAATIGIAHNLNMIPLINTKDCNIAKYFNFPNTVTSDISEDITCNELGSLVYSNCSKQYKDGELQNIEVTGYRQSWKYFSQTETVIRDVFEFKSKYLEEAKLFIAKISESGCSNVCIHVRRGDFLHSKEQAAGRTVADTDYLSKAMQFYDRKLTYVRFIVLSDDIKWCKVNIKGNVTFSPYKDPGVDLAIMSLCDHVIVTSGSFGWWGAWLSNGTVVYYHGFPRNGSKMFQRFNSADYYPPHWIKL